MKTFKFFWNTHKWMGILGGVVFLNLAVTGFLLLVKKDHAWLQPPTQVGRVTWGQAVDSSAIVRVPG